MQIPIEPNLDVPPPTNSYPQRGETYEERLKIAGNTALILSELGLDNDLSDEENTVAASMLEKLKPGESKTSKPSEE